MYALCYSLYFLREKKKIILWDSKNLFFNLMLMFISFDIYALFETILVYIM